MAVAPTNLAIASLFDEIGSLYKKYADLDSNNVYRAKTYDRAAAALRKYEAAITSGQQLKKDIKGFGTSTANDVDEYLQSGRISRLDELKNIATVGPLQIARSDIPIPAYAQKSTYTSSNTQMGSTTASCCRSAILKQLQKISGIGKVTAEKLYDQGVRSINDISVYYNNGQIKLTSKQVQGYLDYVKNQPANAAVQPTQENLAEKQKILTHLQTLRGVGPAIANQWYNLGIRSVADVGNAVNAGKITLTAAQRLGYIYYNDLMQAIPRAEIDQMVEIIQQRIGQYYQFLPAGSYRRGAAESGDLDVLIKARPDGSLQQVVELIGANLIATLSHGQHVYQGIFKVAENYAARRIDLKWIDRGCWPCATLHFTGSGDFNVKMRQRAIALGLKLSEYGLVNKDGHEADIQSEEDIFTHLAVKYLPPAERTADVQLTILTDQQQ